MLDPQTERSAMRLVFVSQAHPETPHVSGMRAWFFARELAARGHQVAQICQWREGARPVLEAPAVAELSRTHDWGEPLLVCVKPRPRRVLERIRCPGTPRLLRKSMIAWSYLRHSGVFTDFSDGVQPLLRAMAGEFRPQAVWGVFGNTDCWLVAQRLAHVSGCPWVADMKDSWEVFMRPGLRRIIARRFGDMAASTANAGFNARVLERWFYTKPAVVYSGVADCFLGARPAPVEPGAFRITLTGSIYGTDSLKAFVDGLAGWLTHRAETGQLRAEVIYAGGDHEKVGRALARLEGLAAMVVHGYVPLAELAALCRSAAVNAYIWNAKTFHHKLLELVACGRPVLAFPGETEESRSVAFASGGHLLVCRNPVELMDALDAVRLGRLPTAAGAFRAGDFSWGAQARALEQVLQGVCPVTGGA